MTTPVLVIGIHSSIAIATLRSLSSHGIDCIGISHKPKGAGLWSKHLKKGYYLKYLPSQPDQYCEQVIKIAKLHNCAAIMCHHEQQMIDLNNYIKDSEQKINLLFPDNSILQSILSKSHLLAKASDLGIKTPKTYTLNCTDDLIKYADSVEYPVILKPSASIQNPPEAWDFKCRYFANSAELLQLSASYPGNNAQYVLQEYVIGIYQSIGLAITNGTPVAAFQWIAEREQSIGLGSFRRSVPLNNKLFNESILLCKEMGFNGVCEVEFKTNLLSGESTLMEINPRLWGGISFPVACGVDFPYIAYQIGLGKTPQPTFQYTTNTWSRNTYGDLKWLFNQLINKNNLLGPRKDINKINAISEYIRSLGKAISHDLDSINDPAPSIRHILHKLKIYI